MSLVPGYCRAGLACMFLAGTGVLPFALPLALPFALPIASAQEIRLNDGSGPSLARAQRVHLMNESLTIVADKPDWIEIRFQIDPGLHINSHTPHDELLVPTNLEIAPASGTKVLAAEYPAGVPLRLEVGAGETLSTYQGEFRVRLRVVAPRGESSLAGNLRYQACDQHSCFPPKSLPVHLAIIAH